MKKLLINCKYWQIIASGILAVVIAFLILAAAVTWAYGAFPDGYGWVMTAHLLGSFAVAWGVPTVFIKAYTEKQIADTHAGALQRMLDRFLLEYPKQNPGTGENDQEPVVADRG